MLPLRSFHFLQEMEQGHTMQRRMISGNAALALLRDVAVALESTVAPRVASSTENQIAADAALQSVIDGHDVKNWQNTDTDVQCELARRWHDLAAECASFADASMLSLPWGSPDRFVRDLLLTQMMQSPPAASLAA
jgi:hypothetical protein